MPGGRSVLTAQACLIGPSSKLTYYRIPRLAEARSFVGTQIDAVAQPEDRHMPRTSGLRALHRLLEYAIAESEELGLAQLDTLLGVAALMIRDELNNLNAPPPDADTSS
jgi:hypothetical protein